MNPEQTQQNTGTSVTEKIETLLFYSKDWMKLNMNMKSFSFFAPYTHCDILITEQFLYLIKLPSSLFRKIFYYVLVPMGSLRFLLSSFEKTNDKVRAPYLDSNKRLISNEYEKMTILKIPKENFKISVLFGAILGGVVTFKYNNDEIMLQGSSLEYNNLKAYIESL